MKRSRKLLLFVLLPAIVLVLAFAPMAVAWITHTNVPYTQSGGSASLTSIYIYVADASAVSVDSAGRLTVSDSCLHSNTVLRTIYERGTVYATGGSRVTLKNSEVFAYGKSGALQGPQAVYALGAGSLINLTDCYVFGNVNAARGLYTQAGGKIVASECNVHTYRTGGGAAVATSGNDGGTITLRGGQVWSHGAAGSAAFYSTGVINATSVMACSDLAEGACVDGPNSLTLSNSWLTSVTNKGVSFSNSTLIDDGTSIFTMSGGWLKSGTCLFYAPNSWVDINLKGVDLTAGNGVLLTTAWDGGFGGNNYPWNSFVDLVATSQVLTGDVITDVDPMNGRASVVDMTLKTKSVLTGTVNALNTGFVNLSIDKTSKWVVTGTSYVNALKTPATRGGSFTFRGGVTVPNIYSPGYTVYYNPLVSPALGGLTIPLPGGGRLVPLPAPLPLPIDAVAVG